MHTRAAPKRVASSASQQVSAPPFELLLLYLCAVAFLAAAIYANTAGIGFLLDDYLHQEYLFRAFNGQPAALWQHLAGGWSQATDGLSCYRPGTTLSLAVDYAFWQNNSFGYHLTNIAFFCATTAIVGLLAFELALLYELRHVTLASVGSAVLFCCYPLHAESVSWVIGRVDVLCTFFYALSLTLVLNGVRTSSRVRLYLAPAALFAALACKEMAVTLPLVLTAGMLLWPIRHGDKRKALKYMVAAHWSVLAAFAVLRTLAIGSVVGGYGSLNKHSLSHGLKHLLDAPSALKVLFGSNEEVSTEAWWRPLDYALLGLAGVSAVASTIRTHRLLSLFAFLTGWTILAVLPTFQIWHISPNLVGSRLFYLSSVPFCMLIAFGLTGITQNSRRNKLAVIAACAVTFTLASLWFALLLSNLTPWYETGKRMGNLVNDVQRLASQAPEGQRILFANLPADYKGAPLVACPEYFENICRPPIAKRDLSSHIDTCERPIPGPHDYIYPSQFQDKLARDKSALVWDNADGRFIPWSTPLGATDLSLSGAGIANTRTNDVRWISTSPINPLKAQVVSVQLDRPVEKLGRVYLVWRAPNQTWWQCEVSPVHVDKKNLLFVPARLRTWTFASSVTELGVRFADIDAKDDLPKIEIARTDSHEKIEPKISIDGDFVRFDATAMPQCKFVLAYVSEPNQAFSDLATNTPPIAIANGTMQFGQPKGLFRLHQLPALRPGTYQICAQAFDATSRSIGVLSEPVTITISGH